MTTYDAGGYGWADLPDELVYRVALHSPLAAIAALARVDHRTRNVCLDDRLWRRLYQRDYGSCRSTRGREETCHRAAAAGFRGGDILSCASPWLGITLSSDDMHSGDAQPTTDVIDLGQWRPHDGSAIAAADAGAPHVWQRTPPWEWWALFDQGPPGCLCWWPPDAPADHRWAYASLQTPGGLFGRFPDMPLRRVGCMREVKIGDWGRGYPRDVKMTYRGEFDDECNPHGRGMAVAVGRCGIAPTVHRISGHWVRGRLHGWAAVWRGCSYFEGHHDSGQRHGPGLNIEGMHEVVHGRWEGGLRKGSGVARTYTGTLIHYGPASGDRHDDFGVVRRHNGSVAFAGRFAYDRPCNGRLYDEQGRLLYEGDVTSNFDARDSGTVYVDDYGVTVAASDWTKSPLPATITYGGGGGDMIDCTVPSFSMIAQHDPIVIRRFTYSAAADPGLAGTVLDGPWQILGTTLVDSHDDVENQDDHRRWQQQAQQLQRPLDIVVTQVSDMPGASPYIKAVRSLCDMVFWPRSDGTAARDAARRQFLDYMAGRYGSRWVTCREVAYATGW
ncbi:F-box domain protein [Pandoravirus inopinatum]|uniref:F-box domain protein n=1 Tax=Pandoravirus inopinatum TaxID=1605721 RepID=A0A0B5J5Y3_9VIRU|nr:F-box domain protein [Pandoravirus inopinatum]AJF97115.1 F-box domain protein [Pandoravirus inopinatum]